MPSRGRAEQGADIREINSARHFGENQVKGNRPTGASKPGGAGGPVDECVNKKKKKNAERNKIEAGEKEGGRISRDGEKVVDQQLNT